MQRDTDMSTIAEMPRTVIEVPNEGGDWTFRPSDIKALSPEARRSLTASCKALAFKRAPPLGIKGPEGLFALAMARADIVRHTSRASVYIGRWDNGASYEVTQRETPDAIMFRASLVDVRRSVLASAEAREAYLKSLADKAAARRAGWRDAAFDRCVDMARHAVVAAKGELDRSLYAAGQPFPRGGALAVYDPAFAASQVAVRPSATVAPKVKTDKRLTWVRSAMSTDDTRPNLQAVYHLKDGTIACSDGSRLHYVDGPKGKAFADGVPDATGEASVTSLLKDMPKVIADAIASASTAVAADATEWAEAIKMLRATRIDRKAVYCCVESDAKGVRLVVGESAIVVTPCPAPVTRRRGIDSAYLAAAVKGARGPIVLKVNAADSDTAVTIERADGGRAIVMPMRMAPPDERAAKLASVEGAEGELFAGIEALELSFTRRTDAARHAEADEADSRINAAQSALARLRPPRPYVPPALVALGFVPDPCPEAVTIEATEPVTERLPVEAPPAKPAPIVMVPVVSSNLAAIGYDPGSRTLRVSFASGALYAYAHVPADAHAALMAAESKGGHFARAIKAHPDRYPFEQLREPDPVDPIAQIRRANEREIKREIAKLTRENERLRENARKRGIRVAA